MGGGEHRDQDEEEDNKVQGSVGKQIKRERKVGGRAVKLTKMKKQSHWGRKKKEDPSRTLSQ